MGAEFVNARTYVMDALINAVTGQGLSGDKNMHSRYTPRARLDKLEVETMYREDWIAAKAIDIVAKDMLREGRTIKGLEPDELTKMERAAKKLKFNRKILEGRKWAGIYGGAAIVLALEGTGEPHEPLELDRIKEGSLKYIQVLDRYRISASETVTSNPLDENFGLPRFYIVAGVTIHHSRVIRMPGIELPKNLLAQTAYWGDSFFERWYDSIVNARTVYQAIAAIVHEASQDTMKIPDLMEMVGDCEGEKKVFDRLQIMKLTKSIHNMLILDQDEEYESSEKTFTGLPQLIREYMVSVAAAADIPLTRLVGVSAGGLNATGEGDNDNYDDKISADQEEYLTPVYDILDEVLHRSLFGKPLPDEYEYEYNSLDQPTEEEQATVAKVRMDRHTLASTLLPESVVLKAIAQEGDYEVPEEHIKMIEQLEKEAAESGDDEDEDEIIEPGEPDGENIEEPEAEE